MVVYRTTVDDEIDFDPTVFRYRKIARSLPTGIEFSGRLGPDRPVSPSLSYVYASASPRDGEDRGHLLKIIPRTSSASVSRPRSPEAFRWNSWCTVCRGGTRTMPTRSRSGMPGGRAQLYTKLAESTNNKLAAAVVREVADEERVHAGEFLGVQQELAPMKRSSTPRVRRKSKRR